MILWVIKIILRLILEVIVVLPLALVATVFILLANLFSWNSQALGLEVGYACKEFTEHWLLEGKDKGYITETEYKELFERLNK